MAVEGSTLEARVLESAGLLAISWDPRDDRFTCSEKASEVLELVCHRAPCDLSDFLDCLDPEDRHAVRSSLLACLEDGKRRETRFRILRDDTPTVVEYRAELWRVEETDRRVEGFFGPIRSLDALQSEIEDLDALVDTLLDHSSLPTWLASPRGVMLRSNRAYRRFSALGFEGGQGKFPNEYSLFRDPALESEGIRDCLRRCFELHESVSWPLDARSTGRVQEAENYAMALDPILDRGGRLRYVLVRYRSEPEQRLCEERAHLDLLLDTVKAQVWHLDERGRVITFNGRAARETGFTQREVVGGSILSLSPNWDDPPRRYLETLTVIKTGQPQLGAIQSYRAGDEVRWVSVDKVPLKNSRGEVRGLLMFIYDITQLKRKEEELKQSEDRYRAYITTSKDAIFRIDVQPGIADSLPVEQQLELLFDQGLLKEFNEAFLRSLGEKHPAALQDVCLRNLDGDGFWKETLEAFIRGGYLIESREWRRRVERRELWTSTSMIGTVEQGRLVRIWGTQRDITERRRHLVQLEYQADHDHLTGLPNRNYFWKKIGEVLQESRREGVGTGLLLLDINRFKEINDSLGHFCGDTLLMKMGERLDRLPRTHHSFVARLGGDEFAIILERLESTEQAKRFAHRLLALVRKPIELAGMNVEVGGSIGIAIYPSHGQDGTKLLRCADVAMYQAKEQPCGYQIYNEDLDEYTPERLSMISDLGQAIRDGELSLHYQPKVGIFDPDGIIGLEALTRWNHPTQGAIPPGRFIPFIELSDMIRPMTLWVLETALTQWQRWQVQGIPTRIAVNLSTRNLVDESIVGDVKDLLGKYQVQPWSLELEITESAIMTDYSRALKILESLHDLDVSLSIDDFGTGYSSLAYLKRLPVQALKIDLSFVQNMVHSEPDRVIVSSTITMAHNLGLQVIAEGVEDLETLVMLKEMGCDQVQGYYVSRPECSETITSWLKCGGPEVVFKNLNAT